MYDVMIIGAGPAGLSAAIYAGRAGLKTLVLEKGIAGGQIAATDVVENYPGGTQGESGAELADRMRKQAISFDAEFVRDTVKILNLEGKEKVIIGSKGEYRGKTVILAMGTEPKKIGCVGEQEWTGRGVSYCATCDGAFFRGREVYVVGGGDSAVQEALFLTRFARKVTIIHRRDSFRAAKSLVVKAEQNPKISVLWNTRVVELKGDMALNAMVVEDTKTGERTEIRANETDGLFGLFGFVGLAPMSALAEGSIAMDEGYIVTNDEMHTNIPGVYAAGDIRKKKLRQVVTAVSDGAIAAVEAEAYIDGQ